MGDLVKLLQANWTVVVEAPWVFVVFALLFGGGGWALGRFLQAGIIDNLKSRLALRDDQIADHRRKLDGSSPDEARHRTLAPENQLHQPPPQPMLVELAVAVPPTEGLEPSESHTVDPSKVTLIDQLYPLIHDFSEIDVDRFGNRAGDWRKRFLDGEVTEYADLMNTELRNLSAAFETFRPIFSRHRYYRDLYEMDDAIAQRINDIGIKLTEARVFADHFSHRFDERTIVLVDPKIGQVYTAVGALRRFLAECLERLATLRNAAS